MYYLVLVDHNSMVAHLTRSRSAVYPMQWVKLMIIYCGMAVKGMEILGVSARKTKALTECRDNDTDW
jgi:hypothetical protein